jgi:uncharacterized protein
MVSLANLTLPQTPPIDRIGKAALVRIHEQARLQVKGRGEGRTYYELLEPVESGKGLTVLPAPSLGDVFLDLESNPYVLDQGLEYLIGFLTLSGKSEPQYEALWSFNRAEEKKAFETFIANMMDRWQDDPSMCRTLHRPLPGCSARTSRVGRKLFNQETGATLRIY